MTLRMCLWIRADQGKMLISLKKQKLCADEIVIFAESKDELQQRLDALLEYCNRWKLVVNTRKN